MSERLAAALNRFYLRIRHPEAFGAAREPGTAAGFETLRGRKYCLLTTFRRSGEPIPTPVWFGVGPDGRLYVRSEADVGKVKRIRATPRARVTPCTLRGRPLGPTTEATARLLAPDEEARAEAALASNYGLLRSLYEGAGERMGTRTVYIEITAGATAPPAPGGVGDAAAASPADPGRGPSRSS